MKIAPIATLAAIAALTGVAATSSAQTNGPTGVSARVGVFFPTDDLAFSTAFSAGVDYKFKSFSLKSPGEGLQSYLGASLDYYGSDGSSNVPLALTYNVRSGSLVYSAGIGVDFYDVDRSGDTGTSLGGQIGIAYEFSNVGRIDNPIFVSAKYFLTDRSELSGFGLYVGVRF